MATSNTRFTQNSLGQSKNPIDNDHGIYRYSGGGRRGRPRAEILPGGTDNTMRSPSRQPAY